MTQIHGTELKTFRVLTFLTIRFATHSAHDEGTPFKILSATALVLLIERQINLSVLGTEVGVVSILDTPSSVCSLSLQLLHPSY